MDTSDFDSVDTSDQTPLTSPSVAPPKPHPSSKNLPYAKKGILKAFSTQLGIIGHTSTESTQKHQVYIGHQSEEPHPPFVPNDPATAKRKAANARLDILTESNVFYLEYSEEAEESKLHTVRKQSPDTTCQIKPLLFKVSKHTIHYPGSLRSDSTTDFKDESLPQYRPPFIRSVRTDYDLKWKVLVKFDNLADSILLGEVNVYDYRCECHCNRTFHVKMEDTFQRAAFRFEPRNKCPKWKYLYDHFCPMKEYDIKRTDGSAEVDIGRLTYGEESTLDLTFDTDFNQQQYNSHKAILLAASAAVFEIYFVPRSPCVCLCCNPRLTSREQVCILFICLLVASFMFGFATLLSKIFPN